MFGGGHMKKLLLYYHTIKYLKFSQICYRICRRLQRRLYNPYIREAGTVPSVNMDTTYTIPELDLDPDYLGRFNPEELQQNIFTFLHLKKKMDIRNGWNNMSMPHLWRFNLHYFEYLYSIANACRLSKDEKYYEKYKEIIREWIKNNPIGKGDGWHPYTISMRLPNWICTYELLYDKIDKDLQFKEDILRSLYTQYRYLQRNVEKDIRGNHYLENLKALILGSIFFKKERLLQKYMNELDKQIKEQILEDGMHFELSPMYHNIALEALIKINFWTRQERYTDTIARMLCVTCSMAQSSRLPFFNDCGEGVAKSARVMMDTAQKYFYINPQYRTSFEAGGYYILPSGPYRCIIDAGKIGPEYLPGHGHCDALSYELSVNGELIIVNSGTYTYERGKWRDYFRSTRAHNTLTIDDTEQSECWESFRVARRIKDSEGCMENHDGIPVFRGSCLNYKEQRHARSIMWIRPDILLVVDRVFASEYRYTKSYIHIHPQYELIWTDHWEITKEKKRTADIVCINADSAKKYRGDEINGWYAPEFGLKCENDVLEIISHVPVSGYIINFSNQPIDTALWERIMDIVEKEKIKSIK